MISNEQLEKWQKDAVGSVDIKLKGALKAHAWNVLCHTIGSFELIEMTSELLNFRKKYGQYEGLSK